MKRHFGGVWLGALLIVLLAGGVLLLRAYKQPLAPPLVLKAEAAAPAVAEKPAFQVNKTCGMSGAMILMIIGRDDDVWVPPYGADAVRYASVDFDRKTIGLFDFHRDLLLDTPSLKEPYGIVRAELGEVYTAVGLKEADPAKADRAAANAVAQAIFDNFAVRPDHYITLKESMLWDVIDILGGVEVEVPVAIEVEGVQIDAGARTLDGRTAELYVRYLPDTGSVWTRTDRQNAILFGLHKKLIDPAVIAKLPDLYQEFQDAFVTDLSPEQINALVCMLKEVPANEVGHSSIPRSLVTVKDADGVILIHDLSAARKLAEDALKP